MSTPAKTRTDRPGTVTAAAPELPAPSACRHCKEERGFHGWTNSGNAGLHQYTEPTAEQRRERIEASIARQRAVRETPTRQQQTN